MAGKGFAGEARAILGEGGGVQAVADIQGTLVIAGQGRFQVAAAPSNRQIAEVAIAAESVVAALVGAIPVVVARPQALLVELDAFLVNPAKEHRPHAAVADGQGLGRPSLGRLAIPENARHSGRHVIRRSGRERIHVLRQRQSEDGQRQSESRVNHSSHDVSPGEGR